VKFVVWLNSNTTLKFDLSLTYNILRVNVIRLRAWDASTLAKQIFAPVSLFGLSELAAPSVCAVLNLAL